MANTFTQIYLHIIFAVKNRGCVISNAWRSSLHEYIGGIAKSLKCKALLVGGVEDHIHMLVSFNKNITIPKFVQDVKTGSTLWVNKNKLCKCHFEWQDGYGGFSVSASGIGKVEEYILNQEMHHKKMTFREEFEAFLKAYGMQYDSQFLPYNPNDIEE